LISEEVKYFINRIRNAYIAYQSAKYTTAIRFLESIEDIFPIELLSIRDSLLSQCLTKKLSSTHRHQAVFVLQNYMYDFDNFSEKQIWANTMMCLLAAYIHIRDINNAQAVLSKLYEFYAKYSKICFEFKKELETLAHQSICVFYSTHSPYMIQEDWGQVYNITMTNKGTQVTTFETGDELCKTIITELGARTTYDILFNLSKTIILVEGIADKTCIEKFAKLLNYDLSDYHIHICEGDAILQVAYICLKHKFIKVKVVLDNDNKYKNGYYKRTHSMYRQCIDLLNDHPNCHIYIGEGENGCLEDLFVGENNHKYMYYDTKKQRWKVDINSVNKIESINKVNEQTKANFEHLFTQLFDGSKH